MAMMAVQYTHEEHYYMKENSLQLNFTTIFFFLLLFLLSDEHELCVVLKLQ